MASRGGIVITTQPRPKREVEKFLNKLDLTQVVGEQIFSYRLQLLNIFLLFVHCILKLAFGEIDT